MNIKKGQFVAPAEMATAAEKVASTGNEKIILTERGASFGYQNLAVDMCSIPTMKNSATRSCSTRRIGAAAGRGGKSSGGQPEFIEPLARASVAAGADGIFVEVHDNPAKALSDGSNALPLEQFTPLVKRLMEISKLVRAGQSMSLETAKRVLRIEAELIAGLIERLDARFEQVVELLYRCKGRVVVTGMGKSGLIGRKIAATFASTGTPSHFFTRRKRRMATSACWRPKMWWWRFPRAARPKSCSICSRR